MRARSIQKSKSLQTDGLGTFLAVENGGRRKGCKNVGRRGGFEEGLRRCVSRGRRNDFVLCAGV